jgi:hypothetical protein
VIRSDSAALLWSSEKIGVVEPDDAPLKTASFQFQFVNFESMVALWALQYPDAGLLN